MSALVEPLQFPDALRNCLDQAAQHLGEGLKLLDWPGGNRDAPCHEINALLSFYYFLSKLDPAYRLYAEGTIGQRGRVDLMGFNGDNAIAVEAKSFGRINNKAKEALNDLMRLKEEFVPVLSEVADHQQAIDWWGDARQRWGIVLITSFRGPEIARAWKSNDKGVFVKEMESYKKSERALIGEERSPSSFVQLWEKFSCDNKDAFQISDGRRWKECGEGWLLWGAIPLALHRNNRTE